MFWSHGYADCQDLIPVWCSCSVLASFLLTWHRSESSRRGRLSWENASIRQICRKVCGAIFLIKDLYVRVQSTVSGATPGRRFWVYKPKQKAEVCLGYKPGSRVLPWSLSAGSRPAFPSRWTLRTISTQVAFDHGLYHSSRQQIRACILKSHVVLPQMCSLRICMCISRAVQKQLWRERKSAGDLWGCYTTDSHRSSLFLCSHMNTFQVGSFEYKEEEGFLTSAFLLVFRERGVVYLGRKHHQKTRRGDKTPIHI